MRTRLKALRVALIYGTFGAVWVLITDWLASDGAFRLFPFELQTAKGLLYVAVTATLVYTLIRLMVHGVEKERTWYRELFVLNPEPMWVYDLKTLRFLAVNKAAVERYGYSRSEFLGMTLADIRPLEDVPELQRHLTDTESRGIRTGVWRHTLKNGRVIQAEVSAHTVEFDGRQAEMVLAHDLTERLEAEDSVKAAKQFLDTVMTCSPLALMTIDSEGRVLSWNESSERIFGWKAREALGKPVPFIPAEKQAEFARLRHRVLAGETLTGIELTRQRKDGTPIETRLSASRLSGSDGITTGILAIVEDITHRKHSEAQLESTEQRLRLILNSIRDGIIALNGEGHILGVNPAASLMLGWAEHEMIGLDAHKLFHRDPRGTVEDPGAECPICQTLHDGEARQAEEEYFTRKDGTSLIVEYSCSPLPGGTGVTGAVVSFRDITDRKQAEEDLRESENRFRELAENIHDVFYSYDPHTKKMFYISPAYTKLWGRSVESLYENPLSYVDAVHPDDLPTMLESLERQENGERTDTEYRVIRPDGQTRWVRDSSYPILGADGKVVRTVGVTRNVTDRKVARDALHESEASLRRLTGQLEIEKQRLEEAQAVAKVGSWETDLATFEVVWSAETYRIFGVDPKVFRPTHAKFLELVHPEDRDTVSDSFNRGLIHAEPAIISHRIIRPDGSVRNIEGKMKVVRDENGRPIRASGTSQDITERTRIELERERLITAIEQTDEIVLITDPNGAIEFVNAAFERVTGYSTKSVLGKNPRLLKSGQQDESFYADLWKTVSGGNTWQGRMINRRKNGSLYTEENIISPVRDALGTITHFVAVKRDVTERLRLEEKYRQSQKMEAIGQLAGGVAHDFNNMLTVILVRAEQALKRTEGDTPLHAGLLEIHAAAERSAALTRQLLTYARRQAVQPRVLDLNASVNGTLGMLRRLIGEDIELNWLPGEALWPVEMDPIQIDQLLANLCINARDAIKDVGKVVIETSNVVFDQEYCRRHEEYKPGSYVMLAVTDNGSGMDKETQSHLFEPFFTTKEVGKGTGLGLATVYGIVQQNRGFINVYSEPGNGTTFKIYLSRHGTLENNAGDAREGNMIPARGETVLLVEDEAMILTVTAEMLKELGYRVILASTPEEALRLAATPEGRADLLLTDIVMPGMNGRDLSRRVLALQPDIRCVFMSGYTASVMAQRSLMEGSRPFLQKPFSTVDLATKLREALENSPGDAGPSA